MIPKYKGCTDCPAKEFFEANSDGLPTKRWNSTGYKYEIKQIRLSDLNSILKEFVDEKRWQLVDIFNIHIDADERINNTYGVYLRKKVF